MLSPYINVLLNIAAETLLYTFEKYLTCYNNTFSNIHDICFSSHECIYKQMSIRIMVGVG